MDNWFSSLFKVKVNFAESHTMFPTIVLWVLLFLLMLIFLFYGLPYLRELARGEKKIQLTVAHIDKLRLIGTVVLTIVYFQLMDYVGRFFPNMGYGFLLVSMPFILLLSLLYVHGLNRSKLLFMSINAIVAPSMAWFILARLFNITLP